MHLRVLGCHGGETPTHRTTCFLIDGALLLDAGSLARGLTIAEQAKINDIFISHGHLDHVQDLALLADNVIGLRDKPVNIWCSQATADTLERHFFNDKLWPDFTRIPSSEAPTVRIQRMVTGQTVDAGGYKVRMVPVSHPVDCQALFVRGPTGTIVYSGETGPTTHLWPELNLLTDLRALILETSLPNRMANLAQRSGRLTPSMMAAELQKWKPKTPARVLLCHMKPAFHDEIRQEVDALKDPRMAMLKVMDHFDF